MSILREVIKLIGRVPNTFSTIAKSGTVGGQVLLAVLSVRG